MHLGRLHGLEFVCLLAFFLFLSRVWGGTSKRTSVSRTFPFLLLLFDNYKHILDCICFLYVGFEH